MSSTYSLPPLSPPPPTSSTTTSPRPPSIMATQRTLEARTAFLASLHSVGHTLDTELQSRARTIHENARALSEQERRLAKSTAALQRETAALEKFVAKSGQGTNGKGKGAMAEFDDLEGLLGSLESELDVLDRTLGLVEGGVEEQEEASEGFAKAGTGNLVDEVREGMEHVELHGSDDSRDLKGKQPEQGAVEDGLAGAEHTESRGTDDSVNAKAKQTVSTTKIDVT